MSDMTIDDNEPDRSATLRKAADFFETKVGYGLLTLLCAFLVWSFHQVELFVHRDTVAAQKAAEQARQDIDLIAKVIPTLYIGSDAARDTSLELLQVLAQENAVAGKAARAILEKITTDGKQTNATYDARTLLNRLVTIQDRQNSSDDSLKTTPARLYIKLGNPSLQSPVAQSIEEALTKAFGIIVPPFQVLSGKQAPQKEAQIRYCTHKADTDTLQDISSIVDLYLTGNQKIHLKTVTLDDPSCKSTRENLFELWLPS